MRRRPELAQAQTHAYYVHYLPLNLCDKAVKQQSQCRRAEMAIHGMTSRRPGFRARLPDWSVSGRCKNATRSKPKIMPRSSTLQQSSSCVTGRVSHPPVAACGNRCSCRRDNDTSPGAITWDAQGHYICLTPPLQVVKELGYAGRTRAFGAHRTACRRTVAQLLCWLRTIGLAFGNDMS